MYIARILYPVKVLGPGDRVGIWFSGCEHHCKGCSNPELWDTDGKYKTDADTVFGLVRAIADKYTIDGFTLTGGDPFYQVDALRQLLPVLSGFSSDILCYSGYEEDFLRENYPDVIDKLAVLIDGKYIEDRNNNVFLRGSDNQNIIIIAEKYRLKYEEYIECGHNEIQNFKTRDSVISVGIHGKEYEKDLDVILTGRGFKQR